MGEKLVLVGGELVTPTEVRFSNLWLSKDRIESISSAVPTSESEGKTLDVSGCYVTPGLIDLQVNGGPPCDFWADPSSKQVAEFCRELVEAGVTSFLPTLITDDLAHLRKNLGFLRDLGVSRRESAHNATSDISIPNGLCLRLPGIHMEGPCLSPQRPGVHPPQFLQPLTVGILEQIVSAEVLLVTVAPELDPNLECLKWLRKAGVTVSMGHSNATFEEASAAFDAGIRLVTHTYNAMPPLHHRAPGAVAAAMLDESVSCCVICDGVHVDPNSVKILFKQKGAESMILVTDVAHVGTSEGGRVGSSIYLDVAVRNVVNWGVATFQQAVLMATLNAAKSVGIDHKVGTILPGRYADVVVWDRETLAVRHVIVGGQIAFDGKQAAGMRR